MRIIWSSGFAAVVVSFTAAVLGYRPIIDVNAYVLLVGENGIQRVLAEQLSRPRAYAFLVELLLKLPVTHALYRPGKDTAHYLSFLLVYPEVPCIVHPVPQRDVTSGIPVLQGVFPHAFHDLAGQIRGVVLVQRFHQTLEDYALRRIIEFLDDRIQLHAVVPEYLPADGAVVAVPGESVQLVDYHQVKQPVTRIVQHSLEFLTVGVRAGSGTVDVLLDDLNVVLLCVLTNGAFLRVNTLVTLVVARETLNIAKRNKIRPVSSLV